MTALMTTAMIGPQSKTQTESEKAAASVSSVSPVAIVTAGKQQEPALSRVARYNGPNPSEMNPRQTEIHDSILRSRPRTGLSGPFGPWLAVPDIAEPASKLGKACRYDTSLSVRESELVILLVGAKTRSLTEFQIHTSEALKAGISNALIESIASLSVDDFCLAAVREKVLPLLLLLSDNSNCDRETAIVTFAAELLQTGTVSDEIYQNTKRAVDNKDSVLVEITSIVGYYTYVCYTLNVFRIPAPK